MLSISVVLEKLELPMRRIGMTCGCSCGCLLYVGEYVCFLEKVHLQVKKGKGPGRAPLLLSRLCSDELGDWTAARGPAGCPAARWRGAPVQSWPGHAGGAEGPAGRPAR
uniref:Uncharacterized protein n=1 Tax=Rangifer tarandus platyrhynchus TaxID=3082113 RepID=A0ACB0DYA0_RANTA|nr:unnamed protein product [Rangifer tarandus platyrhynchus]